MSLMVSAVLAGCAADPNEGGSPRATFASQIAQITRSSGAGSFAVNSKGFTRVEESPLTITLPIQGADEIRFAAGTFEIRVREEGASGAGVKEGEAVTYSRTGGTSFWATTQGGYEEWLLLDAPSVKRGAPVARWHIDGAALQKTGDIVVLTDEAGVPKISVSAPMAYGSDGRTVAAHLGVDGAYLTLSVDAEGEALFVDPTWISGVTIPMVTGREAHTATLLNNGKVLIAGGDDDFALAFAGAELFDPATNAFTATGSMATQRTSHTATLLADGKVLVAGGADSYNTLTGNLASAEIYDPATGAWSAAAPMSHPRVYQTATLLADGRVLVAGGFDVSDYLGSAEIYDPATNTWTATPPMNHPRGFHTATRLQDGRVLLTGGIGVSVDHDAEIYDPEAGTWTAVAPMIWPRYNHAAALLDNGDVLVAGYLTNSEVYHPLTNTWDSVAPLKVTSSPTLSKLGNGRVLAAGGLDDIDVCRSAMEVYDPATATWTATQSLATGRCFATQTLLPSGKVLVSGGVSKFLGQPNAASAELLTVDLSMDASVSYPSGAGSLAYDIETADLNGDGRRDILATASTYLYTAIANPDGTFQSPTRITMHGTPNAVAVGDFNGDGKVDAVTANTTSDVTIRLGYGTGKLKPAVNYAACTTPMDLVALDIDNDGKLDVAVSDRSGGLCVLRGNGNGTFQPPVSYATANLSGTPLGIATGDFNGDGNPDLLLADWLAATNAASLFLGNGDGTLQAAVSVPTGYMAGHLAVADFNADGAQDFVVVEQGSPGYAIVLGDGNGTFQPPVKFLTGYGSDGVTTGDFNGDGAIDIADDHGSVFLGNGDGTFEIRDTHTLASQPHGIAAAPLNGDATTDLVIATQTFGYHVLGGNGDGTFGEPADYALGVGVDSVASADFNGDGHIDVVLANEDSRRPSVLLGGAGGALGTASNLPVCPVVVTDMTAVSTGDFNGDGHPDVVTLYKTVPGGQACVYLGVGDGTFQAPSLVSVGASTGVNMAVGDVNVDGKQDLIVVGSTSSKASVLLGNGNGTFQPGVAYTVSSTPYDVALGDMNGDGKLDIVVASYGGNGVDVLLNKGTGAFNAKSTYTAAQSKADSVALGDFNADGKLDVAATNYGSGSTTVFLNIGAGKLGAGTNYTTGASPRAVVAADLNHDGRVDLAVASSTNSTAGVLLGNGNGTFQSPINFTIGSGARALDVADFDGNGRPDLALACYNSNDVTLLFNTAP